MTEEWFMLLLLYYLPVLFKDWQKSGSCCCCYIVYHYYLRLERGEVHVVFAILSTIAVFGLIEEWFMLWLLYFLTLLFNIWQKRGSCFCCHIVYHYCIMFYQRSGSCCGSYIVYHYCLRIDRIVVHVVVFILSTITV